MILDLARLAPDAVLRVAWLANLTHVNREDLLPSVTPATYGRKQRTVIRWLVRLGEAQWRVAWAVAIVLLVVGIAILP